MDKYYQQGLGFTQPYMNALMDPAALQSQWAEGYAMSPAAQQAQNMATQSGLNAASSMGLMGSQPALQAIQGGASNIALADRQSYLNDLMEKYKLGAGMAGNASSNAMNMGNVMGGLKFGERQAGSNMFGQGLGMLGNLAGNWLTGGFGKGDSFGRGMWSPY